MTVDAYCDGSVSPAQMEKIASSTVSDLVEVGRILVLIPALDTGHIEKAGKNPDSLRMEILAIERARQILAGRGIVDYMILTDNRDAPERAGPEHVRVISRQENYAGIFLDRIIARPRYLRHSSRKVKSRHSPDLRQQEIFRLFNLDEAKFPLSESFIWRKILKNLGKTPSSR